MAGQPRTPAEIAAQLAQAPENNEKVQLYIDASRELVKTDQALIYAQQALKLSQELRFKKGVVNAYTNLGTIYMNRDQYREALDPLDKAARLKKEIINSDPTNLALSIARDYQRLGICYEKLRNNEAAKDSYDRQALYASQARDYDNYAQAKNSLGEVLLKIGSYREAYQAFAQALKYAQRAKSKTLILTIEKNHAQTQTLLQNTEAVQEEIRDYQSQLMDITDSLDRLGESQQVLIEAKTLLELERDKKEAEILLQEAQLRTIEQEVEKRKVEQEALEANLRAKEQEQINFYIATGGGALVALLIIVGLVARARARRRANEALAAEKKKTDDLLLNILPDEIAEELKQHQRVKPVRHDHVSILFTDFKGFTTIASQMEPEALLAKLDEAFEAFDQITSKYGLEKIKTIGDAYMAVAGLPKPDKHHALHAVTAAMEMQEFMDQWIGRLRRKNEPIWELRIGINSGPVVAGVIGNKKFAYDIWGDAVNLASRIESACEPGKVNISASTYELIKYHCDCEPPRTAPLKNKGIVEMYHVREVLRRPQPLEVG
ncbi:MAG: hypothetical protein OHK0039_19030 [Bacteroidia bacterium]